MSPIKNNYLEGQWFSVPLRRGGFALGIIVRGSYKTKGGLGYFFGPKFSSLPKEIDTWDKKPEDAILIKQFGDLGIKNGRWVMIPSSRPFSRDDWPIPKFGSQSPFHPGMGFVREYKCGVDGALVLVNDTLVDIGMIKSLPVDQISFGGSVEIELTKLLDKE
jgi:hypothetical protein